MSDGRVIRVERHVAAPPSAVYAYLTDSARWAQWQGADATIDASPGGEFTMRMSAGQTARGQFVEVVPQQKVVFTWGWLDQPGIPPGSTVVEIELIATDGGTLVRLTHRDLPPSETANHQAGWDHYLSRLVLVASGQDPGPDAGPG